MSQLSRSEAKPPKLNYRVSRARVLYALLDARQSCLGNLGADGTLVLHHLVFH